MSRRRFAAGQRPVQRRQSAKPQADAALDEVLEAETAANRALDSAIPGLERAHAWTIFPTTAEG